MTIAILPDGTITLADRCRIEDAELLQRALLENPDALLDWRACHEAHAAVVQILLIARPRMVGPPAGHFLRVHVDPMLSGAAE